jgi:hypothetical protein
MTLNTTIRTAVKAGCSAKSLADEARDQLSRQRCHHRPPFGAQPQCSAQGDYMTEQKTTIYYIELNVESPMTNDLADARCSKRWILTPDSQPG